MITIMIFVSFDVTVYCGAHKTNKMRTIPGGLMLDLYTIARFDVSFMFVKTNKIQHMRKYLLTGLYITHLLLSKCIYNI